MQNQLETKLNKALMDEYHARDTYRKIIEAFGKNSAKLAVEIEGNREESEAGKKDTGFVGE